MTGIKITFVNVGYGEAILIQIPDQTSEGGAYTVLIDGGSRDPEEFLQNQTGRMPLAAYLKQIGCSHINVLVNTHIHEDHTGGLAEVVRTIPVDAFWQPLPESVWRSIPELDPAVTDVVTGAKYIQSINDFCEICRRLNGKVHQAEAGTVLPGLPAGMRIRVLAPGQKKRETLEKLMNGIIAAAACEAPEEGTDSAGQKDRTDRVRAACARADAGMNNLSIMLMAEYAGRTILLPGDTNRDGYADLASFSADIFKVGHHGQIDGISRDLFLKIHPEYVVCCASSDRRYDSAAPEILSMMNENGAGIWFSDCPPVPEGMQEAPPHNALVFTISEDGKIEAAYE